MATTIYLISKLGNGSLSVMAKPDSTELPAAFNAITSCGASHLVSLLEITEAAQLGLEDEARWCAVHRLEFLHYPIEDFSTPSNLDDFATFTQTLHTLVQNGAHMVVHCRGGIGRAGLTASSVLVHAGLDAEEAMATVSNARGESVPETQDQKAFVQQIERWRQVDDFIQDEKKGR